MTRTKMLLLAASCAVTLSIASPALALNPQPLPPGRTAAPTHVFCANGEHIRR
jgi:hypothetical protein